MQWSSRIGRIGGVDIYIHWSFALVLVPLWLRWTAEGARHGLFASAIVALLFACVTLHELGHTLVAGRLGIEARRIVLWPLGGFAMLSREPERPLHELSIAAAGPLANLLLAGGTALMALVAGLPPRFDPIPLSTAAGPAGLLGMLVTFNLGMALLNLLPIYPLDGGRIMRAGLALMLGRRRATQVMLRVSLLGAVALAGLIFLQLQPGAGFVGAFAVAAAASTTQRLRGRRQRRRLRRGV